jgi:hypothetical protein
MDKLKLSQLIRLGCEMTEACYGAISANDGLMTCALGAALTGKRGELLKEKVSTNAAIHELFGGELNNSFGYSKIPDVKAPQEYIDLTKQHYEMNGIEIKEHWTYKIHDVITALNDNLKWSREQIADWVESVGY